MTVVENNSLYLFDDHLARISGRILVGVDEAGRGPLAGPVVAAAVVLTQKIHRVDDSKKLSAQAREELFSEILSNSIIGIGLATNSEIDMYNILRATNLAMLRAVKRVFEVVNPEECLLIVDGAHMELPGFCINLVKGDSKSASVAAASIVAKVFRDTLMEIYDSIYPGYGFSSNKGYPTPQHLYALGTLGPSKLHRKSFRSTRASRRR
ncbi:MAG: ribonuclease HII [Thermotogae bacterium]|nr:ribonuclease HII [Thermotogota bacterium]